MKSIIKVTSLMLVMIFVLAAFASCGKSMDDVKDKIKDLDEDDYTYVKVKDDSIIANSPVFFPSLSEMKKNIEKAGGTCEDTNNALVELMFKDIIEGELLGYYTVVIDEEYAQIIEFETKDDAKAFQNVTKEKYGNLQISCSGKLVVMADSDYAEVLDIILAVDYEKALDIELDGDVESGYEIYSVDGEKYCAVVEFEKSGDAGKFAKALKKYNDKYTVKRSGNVVAITNNEKLLDKIW